MTGGRPPRSLLDQRVHDQPGRRRSRRRQHGQVQRPAEHRAAPAALPAAPEQRRHARGFWIVGYVFAVTMAFSTVPAALVLGLGVATQFISTQVAVLGFAAALIVVVALAGYRLAAGLRARRPAPRAAQSHPAVR